MSEDLCKKITSPIASEFLRGRRRESPIELLSSHERQILQIILEGKTSAEITNTRSLSIKTIETYRSHMLRKLGIRNLPFLVTL